MVATVMIIEDEKKMRDLLVDYLKHEGYITLEAANGLEALQRFDDRQVDLVILDIMMPRLDGFSVCRNIRESSDVPILLLTAKSEEYDKLQGYELGADDYITKPFSPKVLVAKIKALLKRVKPDLTQSTIRVEGLELNPDTHEIKIDGKPIMLSPKEYLLLLYLAHNKNITLTRDQILEQVWGFDYDGDVRTVDTHIKRLRQKLEHKADLITTVPGFGYKLQVSTC